LARERAESEWADEHTEYDIESEPFVAHVYEMAHPVYTWDAPNLTFQELDAEAPHRAYVVDTYSRLSRLVEVLRSLAVVERLLSVENFPIDTPDGKIHREAWLRVANDAYLARITAVRDCLFLLAASVFELDLKDRDINLKSLKVHIKHPEVIALLQRIAETGRHTRDERDLKFHRGIERDFDERGLYRNLSTIEMWSEGTFDGKVGAHDGSGPAWDLQAVHAAAVKTVRTEMRDNAQALIELALDLFDLLFDEYDERWAARRDRAENVRDWEKG